MVWTGISIEGRTDLHVIDGDALIGIRYRDEILHPIVRSFAGAVGDDFILMDHNARLHFVVYSTRRFVVCLSVCHFVLVFFSPFSIAITSLGEQRANLSAFRTFVWFVLVWICRFPLPLGVWEGLRFVIVALAGLFSYRFFKL